MFIIKQGGMLARAVSIFLYIFFIFFYKLTYTNICAYIYVEICTIWIYSW
jgi:TctA family transporter